MIRVLVVEDEPVAAEAHRVYVERLPGFSVAGVVHSGGEALRFCEREPVDLVLLDFYLPDTHGLAVCRSLRAAGLPIDVIAVTSARDLGLVKAAVSVGVVQYLLKPFTFATLRENWSATRNSATRRAKRRARRRSTACWGVAHGRAATAAEGIERPDAGGDHGRAVGSGGGVVGGSGGFGDRRVPSDGAAVPGVFGGQRDGAPGTALRAGGTTRGLVPAHSRITTYSRSLRSWAIFA